MGLSGFCAHDLLAQRATPLIPTVSSALVEESLLQHSMVMKIPSSQYQQLLTGGVVSLDAASVHSPGCHRLLCPTSSEDTDMRWPHRNNLEFPSLVKTTHLSLACPTCSVFSRGKFMHHEAPFWCTALASRGMHYHANFTVSIPTTRLSSQPETLPFFSASGSRHVLSCELG